MTVRNKKLYRSEDNRVFAGILGGLGEYFDIDPTVLRVVVLFLMALSGFLPGILAYFIAILIVPRKRG